MPPSLIFDLSSLDLDAVLVDQEGIRKVNPQRGDMEQLNAISWFQKDGRIAGYKDVGADEFWVSGHIPDRPLLPGVLMIEAAAQLSSFYVKGVLGVEGFLGFGGVEECKFRLPVEPGVRLHLLGVLLNSRRSRFTSRIQGLVAGQLAFEAVVLGIVM